MPTWSPSPLPTRPHDYVVEERRYAAGARMCSEHPAAASGVDSDDDAAFIAGPETFDDDGSGADDGMLHRRKHTAARFDHCVAPTGRSAPVTFLGHQDRRLAEQAPPAFGLRTPNVAAEPMGRKTTDLSVPSASRRAHHDGRASLSVDELRRLARRDAAAAFGDASTFASDGSAVRNAGRLASNVAVAGLNADGSPTVWLMCLIAVPLLALLQMTWG